MIKEKRNNRRKRERDNIETSIFPGKISNERVSTTKADKTEARFSSPRKREEEKRRS